MPPDWEQLCDRLAAAFYAAIDLIDRGTVDGRRWIEAHQALHDWRRAKNPAT